MHCAGGAGIEGWTATSYQWNSHCYDREPAMKNQPCFLMFVDSYQAPLPCSLTGLYHVCIWSCWQQSLGAISFGEESGLERRRRPSLLGILTLAPPLIHKRNTEPISFPESHKPFQTCAALPGRLKLYNPTFLFLFLVLVISSD